MQGQETRGKGEANEHTMEERRGYSNEKVSMLLNEHVPCGGGQLLRLLSTSTAYAALASNLEG